MAEKYNFNDNFEMLYLRHEYLARIQNVDKIDITPFDHIANTTARIMYDKHFKNFNKMGFEVEDVISVTRIYLVAFLGLYSIDINKGALDRFVAKYKEKNGEDSYPTRKEIIRKDRNNLINFLKQRLSHYSVLCERKGRNVLVGKDFKGVFAETLNSKPACDEEIANDHKKYGYRKVTKKELKEAKEIAVKYETPYMYDKHGFKIIQVEILAKKPLLIEGFSPKREYDGHTFISSSNYSLMHGERRDIYSNDPEQSYIYAEEELGISNFKKIFFSLDNKNRMEKLKSFIREYGKEKGYKREIKLAKKWISIFKEKHGIIIKHG